ncbi:unnamed protein product [Calypogeia fissa]
MASHRVGHKLFYLVNSMPSLKREAAASALKGADAAVGEACGGSLRNGSHSCHNPRTMASAAELAPKQTGRELLHERGHGRRGFLFRGRRRHSPFDLFDSFFPNRNLRFMMDKMDRLFDDPFFNRSWMAPGGQSALQSLSRPPWDFIETDDDFKMRLDLPGLSKEEVKVHVEDGNLVIEGEHSEENKAEEAQWSSTSEANHYSTRIVLPENANVEMIKAELKNGVLNVTIPKVKVEEPKKKMVEIEIE